MKNFHPSSNSSASNNTAGRVVAQIKISIVFIIAILLIVLKGSSQDIVPAKAAKNAVYAQVSGKADSKSVNFEHIIHTGKLAYSYSVGIAKGTKSVSVPLAFHVMTTASNHHLEMAVAFIPFVEKHSYAKHSDDFDKQMFVKPTIGYRYQKATGGLFIKAGVGPQIFMDPPSTGFWNFTLKLIKASAYLAIGISF